MRSSFLTEKAFNDIMKCRNDFQRNIVIRDRQWEIFPGGPSLFKMEQGIMQREYPDPLTHTQSRRRFQAGTSFQKQQVTSRANTAQRPHAKQSRQQRSVLTRAIWVLLLSVSILCLFLLLFARDAFVTNLSIFLVALLNLVVSLLCLLGFLMLFVFLLLFRLFGRAYSNPL